MIIVDTSVWIDFLNGTRSALPLKTMLVENSVCALKVIEGELRSGFIPGNRNLFFHEYSQLSFLKEPSWEELFLYIEKEKLFGKGLSLIDMIVLATSKLNKTQVWTNDKILKKYCN